MRQLDGRKRAVGEPPQQFVPRAEMMQHRHRVDADPYAELAHGEADLAVARQHVERGVEKCVPVEAPPSAGAGGRFARRFR
jgi:hypothetical protein